MPVQSQLSSPQPIALQRISSAPSACQQIQDTPQHTINAQSRPNNQQQAISLAPVTSSASGSSTNTSTLCQCGNSGPASSPITHFLLKTPLGNTIGLLTLGLALFSAITTYQDMRWSEHSNAVQACASLYSIGVFSERCNKTIHEVLQPEPLSRRWSKRTSSTENAHVLGTSPIFLTSVIVFTSGSLILGLIFSRPRMQPHRQFVSPVRAEPSDYQIGSKAVHITTPSEISSLVGIKANHTRRIDSKATQRNKRSLAKFIVPNNDAVREEGSSYEEYQEKRATSSTSSEEDTHFTPTRESSINSDHREREQQKPHQTQSIGNGSLPKVRKLTSIDDSSNRLIPQAKASTKGRPRSSTDPEADLTRRWRHDSPLSHVFESKLNNAHKQNRVDDVLKDLTNIFNDHSQEGSRDNNRLALVSTAEGERITPVLDTRGEAISSKSQRDSREPESSKDRVKRSGQDTQWMLSKALQKCNTAILLDNATKFEDAIAGYTDTSNYLQQVIEQSRGAEDRRKLEAIKVTYDNRIEELQRLIVIQPGGPVEESPLALRMGESLPDSAPGIQKEDLFIEKWLQDTIKSTEENSVRQHREKTRRRTIGEGAVRYDENGIEARDKSLLSKSNLPNEEPHPAHNGDQAYMDRPIPDRLWDSQQASHFFQRPIKQGQDAAMDIPPLPVSTASMERLKPSSIWTETDISPVPTSSPKKQHRTSIRAAMSSVSKGLKGSGPGRKP